eukprot:TRINITY_DN7729_c0_g1_i1.p1 TRINITY_DN7729_c0_g1~~TRINITY_DN7729_c0_g1_i1.p1  ORF type:complete len:363 (-),score=54.06 TRINITY_DN7729_c0_g1_i1:37-1125(-)
MRFSPDDMDVTCGAAVSYEQLNEHLKPYNMFFPLDPGPGASIGGMIGTSCSGTNAVRYGTMKENVISLTVVTADGRIVKTGRRPRKRSSGYDLTHLFIGAEGTLGVVVDATLKLHHIPQHKKLIVCKFGNNLKSAADTIIKLMQTGVKFGRVEILDDEMIRAINLYNEMDYSEEITLMVEISGTTLTEIESQSKLVYNIAQDYQITDIQSPSDEETVAMWAQRKSVYFSAFTLQPGCQIITTDVVVPISSLAKCLELTKADIKTSDVIAPIVGHVGDGNFHVLLIYDPLDPQSLQRVHDVHHRLVKRAIDMDGSCSGEHGIGLEKKEYLPLELGQEAVDVMKQIKSALDPNLILNPGKIFDV